MGDDIWKDAAWERNVKRMSSFKSSRPSTIFRTYGVNKGAKTQRDNGNQIMTENDQGRFPEKSERGLWFFKKGLSRLLQRL